MTQLILILELVSGIALSTMILMQAKGTGLSGVFGGDGGSYRSRRGVEKLLHRGTIVMALLFISLGVINILISK